MMPVINTWKPATCSLQPATCTFQRPQDSGTLSTPYQRRLNAVNDTLVESAVESVGLRPTTTTVCDRMLYKALQYWIGLFEPLFFSSFSSVSFSSSGYFCCVSLYFIRSAIKKVKKVLVSWFAYRGSAVPVNNN